MMEDEDYFILGPNAELAVRFVCKLCNSGWMSDLECAVKPTMADMIANIAIPLDKQQQFDICRWMLKTALILDAFADRKAGRGYFGPEERKLVSEGRLPSFTHAWLVRYSGGDFPIFSRGVNLWFGGIPNSIESTKAYCYTFAVGFFGAQLLCSRVPPGRDAPVRIGVRPGPWEATTIQIWPTRGSLEWPPPQSLDDGSPGFMNFAERWSWGHRIR